MCVVCVGSPSDAGWRHLSLSGITSGGPNKPSSGLEETEEGEEEEKGKKEKKKKDSSVFPVLSFPPRPCLARTVCVCLKVDLYLKRTMSTLEAPLHKASAALSPVNLRDLEVNKQRDSEQNQHAERN